MLPYTLIATILGGVLTLALLGLRQLPLPAGLARQGWILKLHDPRSGIPYGVALAAGAFVVLPHAEILHLAGDWLNLRAGRFAKFVSVPLSKF